MKLSPPRPTEAELEILQILWAHGPQTVRDINALLSDQREVGYTTTLKILQIMHDKGLVKRDISARSHIYAAAVDETETRGRLLDVFLDATFGGSAANMVMHALGRKQPSREELEQIRRMLDELGDEP